MWLKRTIAVGVVLATTTLAAPGGMGGAATESNGVTTRVSVTSDGRQAQAPVPAAATSPAVSSDGAFVAFVSDAANLSPDDTNGLPDVYVLERAASVMTRVSVGPGGAQADGPSSEPVVSNNGQFVAFVSEATNLVLDDRNGAADVFVHDRVAKTTQRLSLSTSGAEADGPSTQVAISGLGDFVAFASEATNLADGDTNAASDVFVRGRGAGDPVHLVSAAAGGRPGNDASFDPDISADGTVVAFASDATDLLDGDTNRATDVFIRGREGSPGTTRVSVESAGGQADGPSFDPSLANDVTGTSVAFASLAANLAEADTNNTSDIFLRHLPAGTEPPGTIRVSVSDGQGQSSGYSYEPEIASDGQRVAFLSEGDDLLAPPERDTNAVTDAYIRNFRGAAGATTARISQSGLGTELSDATLEVAIDPEGEYAGFSTGPLDPSTGLAGSGSEVLVRGIAPGGTATARVSAPPGGSDGTAPATSLFPAMSADGRFVAFSSSAADLVAGDSNRASDIFVHDRQTRATTRISVGPQGAEADGPSLSFPFLSGDGRFVTFSSDATNLVAGDNNGVGDVYVHDRQTGTTSRVSVGAEGVEANGPSSLPSISADGRYVAFESDATNLVGPSDTNATRDVFVHDREAGVTTRISVGANGEADGSSEFPSISGDGRYVAFASRAGNLMAGPARDGGVLNIYVYDRSSATTVRVSAAPDGTPGGKDSEYPITSPDGRFVTFASSAGNLVAGDTNRQADVFLWDRERGGLERVSVASDGAEVRRPSRNPWVSGDGRYVAFESQAPDLVPGDTNGKVDAFVRDRLLGTTVRASAVPGGQADGESRFPTLSADGRYVAFLSRAANLVGGDTNAAIDVFVHDLRPARGYWVVASDGKVFSYGNAQRYSPPAGEALNKPVVGAAATPTGEGYWLVASDGGIFTYGDAAFAGSAGGVSLNQPIVAMTPRPDGAGYWLAARDGGIFNYGTAAFHGSAGDLALNRPIVGMAATPSGAGYWLVASDGGIFAFGDAPFLGSTGDLKLNQPIVGMAATTTGEGYWLVAADGGLFAFGDARFFGSTGGTRINKPIVGMLPTPGGGGYWLVAADGGVFTFGNADFLGSTGAMKLSRPAVALIGRR
jgi:Tol biopolymer transport system component